MTVGDKLTDKIRITFNESPISKIDEPQQLLRVGNFKHPIFGEFDITKDILLKFKENFDSKVRRVDLAVDYSHESDQVAAGWIENVELKEDNTELWIAVEWTDPAVKKLQNKEFRYLSADFTLSYKDPESGKTFGPTLFGAGLTNRPFVKEMKAILSDNLNDNEDRSFDEMVRFLRDDLTEDQKAQVVEALGGIFNINLKEEDNMSKETENKEDAIFAEKLEDSIKKLSEANALNAKLQEEKDKLVKELANHKKEGEFNVMLSDGKAVESQREAYLKGDMKAFAENAVAVNLSEKGTDEVPAEKKELTDEEGKAKFFDAIDEEQKKDASLDIKAAASKVLKDQPELTKFSL